MFSGDDQAVRTWLDEGKAALGLRSAPLNLLPLAEAAKQMGVSEAYALDLAHAGLLDSEMRAGRLFVRPVILRTGTIEGR